MTVIDDYMEVCALICVFIVFANLLNLCIKLYWHALLQMAAAWGGYVFVLNMIGIHAALLVILGRFTTKVYLAYTLFYVIGTSLAVQVPVVGWAPLRSLEQLPACAVFLGYQLLQFCEVRIRKQKMSKKDAWKFRFKLIGSAAMVGLAAMIMFTPKGYFGPISSRVRGLFVKHTKTGNPLVDSVAEHQPAKANSYFQYLQHFCTLAPLGLIMILIWFGDSPSFIAAYGVTAYFFSHKMVRLILLLAPVASILGGVALGRLCAWCLNQVLPSNDSAGTKVIAVSTKKGKKGGKTNATASSPEERIDSSTMKWVKRSVAMALLIATYMTMGAFDTYCWKIGKHLSNPSIMQVGQTRDGNIVVVDDYRDAYRWVRDNTPQDARVMAWWDYGYQIASIANRTTIADGNTWNHEHIALLARILTGPAEDGYKIARHMADYMLVWAGGGGDDLAKSPHLARIANSVYRNMCSDPVCSQFGFVQDRATGQRSPSQQMQRSLIARLVSNKPEGVDPTQFQEVFRSKYGKVKVFKIIGVDEESKEWGADPKNRKCDVEGGWFCRGQYPPALLQFSMEGKDFAQLEDFNKKGYDEDYRKQYFDGMKKKEERTKAMKKRQGQKKEL
jgi:dolichyl-diphosphooligosaccharide--protein glycosyltransferase